MLRGDRLQVRFDDALSDHDGVAIAKLIAQRQLSRSEVSDAAIARAEAVNPTLNAITCKAYEYAKQRSEAEPSGALSGVPTFVKDTDALKGFPSRFGSRATSDAPAQKSSDFVQQFEATGVIPLGLSTTPEFGHAGTAEALLTGPTRNPWSLGHSSGGSSGGSAALVAAGVVPFAHANDGAGSIRIPASACGLVGLKPSRGRVVTVDVPSVYPINIFHQGVVSRTVRDTAAVLTAMDRRMRGSSSPRDGLPALPEAFAANARPLKIGVYVDDGAKVRCDSQCASAALAAATACEALGHHIDVIDNPFDAGFDDDFWLCCWSLYLFMIRNFGRQVIGPGFKRDVLEPFTEYMASVFWRGKARFFAARRRIRAFPQRYQDISSRYDVLLTPTLGTPIPELGYIGPSADPAVFHERQMKLLPFTPVHNVSGAPSISLPMAMSTDGTPIGVLFSAQLGQDQRLLELAMQLEAAGAFAPGIAFN